MASSATGAPGVSDDSKGSGEKYKGKVKKRAYRSGVKLHVYGSEVRSKILAEMANGARNSEICRILNIPESTVHSMRRKREELSACKKILWWW